MLKISKKSAAILIIFFCIASVYATKFFISSFAANKISVDTSKAKGRKNAPIKIVEFIDFQCPACASGAEYLKEKIEKYPEAIRVEVKHYPLQMHKHGILSSQYAECASQQGKFWPYQDLLLARQANWSRLLSAQPAFDKIAEEVQLDPEDLKACLSDPKIDEVIMGEKNEGMGKGVRSTPTYFVNGEMFVGKKSLDEQMTKLLEKNGY